MNSVNFIIRKYTEIQEENCGSSDNVSSFVVNTVDEDKFLQLASDYKNSNSENLSWAAFPIDKIIDLINNFKEQGISKIVVINAIIDGSESMILAPGDNNALILPPSTDKITLETPCCKTKSVLNKNRIKH